MPKLSERLIRLLPWRLWWLLNLSPYKCRECKDTGLASYEDWIGARGYRVVDRCRACKRRALSGDAT